MSFLAVKAWNSFLGMANWLWIRIPFLRILIRQFFSFRSDIRCGSGFGSSFTKLQFDFKLCKQNTIWRVCCQHRQLGPCIFSRFFLRLSPRDPDLDPGGKLNADSCCWWGHKLLKNFLRACINSLLKKLLKVRYLINFLSTMKYMTFSFKIQKIFIQYSSVMLAASYRPTQKQSKNRYCNKIIIFFIYWLLQWWNGWRFLFIFYVYFSFRGLQQFLNLITVIFG